MIRGLTRRLFFKGAAAAAIAPAVAKATPPDSKDLWPTEGVTIRNGETLIITPEGSYVMERSGAVWRRVADMTSSDLWDKSRRDFWNDPQRWEGRDPHRDMIWEDR